MRWPGDVFDYGFSVRLTCIDGLGQSAGPKVRATWRRASSMPSSKLMVNVPGWRNRPVCRIQRPTSAPIRGGPSRSAGAGGGLPRVPNRRDRTGLGARAHEQGHRRHGARHAHGGHVLVRAKSTVPTTNATTTVVLTCRGWRQTRIASHHPWPTRGARCCGRGSLAAGLAGQAARRLRLVLPGSRARPWGHRNTATEYPKPPGRPAAGGRPTDAQRPEPRRFVSPAERPARTMIHP